MSLYLIIISLQIFITDGYSDFSLQDYANIVVNKFGALQASEKEEKIYLSLKHLENIGEEH